MVNNDTVPSILVKGLSQNSPTKGRYYEDRIKFGQVTTRSGLTIALGIVADGIGGENAGERAAYLTAEGVFQFCQDSSDSDISQVLKNALDKVNSEVFNEGQQRHEHKNMGSTAAVAAIYNNRLYIANVGDSRIYLIRKGNIVQLTKDHTWENEVVVSGKLTAAEAARHPRRAELVRSIGYKSDVNVDLGIYIQPDNLSPVEAAKYQTLQLQPGDQIIICSDGLIKSVSGTNRHFVELPEIIKIASSYEYDAVPKQLIQKALDRNVNDNVSVIVMEVPGGKRLLRRLPKYVLPASGIALLIVLLGIFILNRIQSTPPPQPTLPPLSANNQIYIAQIWNTSLSSGNNSSQLTSGTLLNFEKDETLQTTKGTGYAYIGFPGQAQLIMGSDTEIVLTDLSATQFEILLNNGWLLINQPGRKFVVDIPGGGQAWITGSMMGLHYDSTTQQLYIDCLKDQCWITGGENLQAGSSAVLQGNQIISSGPGTHNEYWQYFPGLVSTPTHTPTLTPMPTSTPKPIIIDSKATQESDDLQRLGTPCTPKK